MFESEPKVFLIARPEIAWWEIETYLTLVDGVDWIDQVQTQEHPGGEGEDLIEFAGRLCYRSWKPGLNPNVKKVRTDHTDYLEHILESGHGSVLEHASYTFVFQDVSRVFTHELVRHRAGVAISQESMRFVRLTDIPMWIPDWAKADKELMMAVKHYMEQMEQMQIYLADYFDLDAPNTPFTEKKEKTSFMRRFAPEGVSTSIVWTANVRELRHVIEARTAMGAEEEMRLVFGKVAEIMVRECPALFGDFDNHKGSWIPDWSKV